MNRYELAKAVAEVSCIEIELMDGLLADVQTILSEALERGEKVTWSGLGTFRRAPGRAGSEKRFRVSFTPSRALGRKLNEGHAQPKTHALTK